MSPRAPRQAAAPLALPEAFTAQAPGLAQALVWWYRQARRSLPWRDTQDPYAIWVSEAMLQQTLVATAIPYFERFMRAFPTLEALAAASPEALMKAWEGLGYYRRARFLQAAAQAVVAQHGGLLPADPAALRALPGFGPYTTGAVSALAFGLPEPAVDGNVERVLARLLACDEEVKAPRAQALWAAAARALYPGQAPSEVAQGLIELGALVCRPKAPRCGACPWAEACLARARGVAEALPTKAPARAPRFEAWAGLWAQDAEGRTLLVQRSEGGIWGGLWTPPLVRVEEVAEEEALWAAFLAGHGLQALGPLGGVAWRQEHRLTHRLLALSLRPARVGGAWRGDAEARWVPAPELGRWAMPKPFQAWAKGLLP